MNIFIFIVLILLLIVNVYNIVLFKEHDKIYNLHELEDFWDDKMRQLYHSYPWETANKISHNLNEILKRFDSIADLIRSLDEENHPNKRAIYDINQFPDDDEKLSK